MRRAMVIGVGTVLAMSLGGSAAVAEGGRVVPREVDESVIRACASNSTGVLRVQQGLARTCAATERRLTWSTRGPAGEAAPRPTMTRFEAPSGTREARALMRMRLPLPVGASRVRVVPSFAPYDNETTGQCGGFSAEGGSVLWQRQLGNTTSVAGLDGIDGAVDAPADGAVLTVECYAYEAADPERYVVVIIEPVTYGTGEIVAP